MRTLRPPADPAEARLRLAELVELFVIGSRQPLPFVPSIARGYAANHGRGRPEQVLERAILDSGRYADAFNGRLDFFWGDRVQERLTRPIGPRPWHPVILLLRQRGPPHLGADSGGATIMNELASQSEPTPAPERWTTRSNESELTTRSAIRDPSTPPVRCRPVPVCWRPAREPARRTRSPPWSPVTSPRDVWTSGGSWWSRSAGPRVANCAIGCVNASSMRAGRCVTPPRTTRAAFALIPRGSNWFAVDEAERAARLERIDRALAGIDDAPILTTHGFAARMLAQGGLASDVDHGRRCVPTPGGSSTRWSTISTSPSTRIFALTSRWLLAYRIAEAVVADPPGRHSSGRPGRRRGCHSRVRFAGAVRSEVAYSTASPTSVHLRRSDCATGNSLEVQRVR